MGPGGIRLEAPMRDIAAEPTGRWVSPILIRIVATSAADKNAGNGYTEHGHIPFPLWNHSNCNTNICGTAAPS